MATLKKAPIATPRVTKISGTSSTRSSVSTVDSLKTYEHTFSNGSKFTGTFEQLEKVAIVLGEKLILTSAPRGFYPSESKGVIEISKMNDYHIRRALLKRSKDYFAGMWSKDDTNKVFLQKFTTLVEDPIIVDLFKELSTR